MKGFSYYFRSLAAILVLIVIKGSTTKANAQDAFKIFDKSGKSVSLDKVIDATRGKSHIFFGELHNNTIAHWLQLELTKSLHQKHGENLVVGAEMFEADNQLLINEYFADQIRQKSFEEEMRLWKNYKTDYKPVLEYAKKNKLRFVATNIPRRYANAVFYNGLAALNAFSVEARSYIAPLPISIDTTLASYREIRKMGGHNARYMMEAQAVKDATMAHFILQNTAPNAVFLHLNGSYHSNNYEGIIPYLTRAIALSKVLTITTVTQADVKKLEKDHEGLADFIICVPNDMTVTY